MWKQIIVKNLFRLFNIVTIVNRILFYRYVKSLINLHFLINENYPKTETYYQRIYFIKQLYLSLFTQKKTTFNTHLIINLLSDHSNFNNKA